MERPKITILLATFNREVLLRETLDSIYSQTYFNWECLITDDRSTDDTASTVMEYTAKDKRFSYHLKPAEYPDGLSGTRNFGLDLAEEKGARFIQFFDDDDIMYPHKLELQIQPLIEQPDLYFSLCKYDKIIEKENGEKIKQRLDYEMYFEHLGDAVLTGKLRMNSLGPLWNMNFLKQFRFDERLRYAEEWELYVRMGFLYPSKKNYCIIDEYLFAYRKHSQTLTLGTDDSFQKRKSSAICKYLICDFLTEKRLHTQTSFRHFSKVFSALGYNQEYLNKLLQYATEEKYPFRSRFMLKAIALTGRLFYKVSGKISTWI